MWGKLAAFGIQFAVALIVALLEKFWPRKASPVIPAEAAKMAAAPVTTEQAADAIEKDGL